MQGRCSSAGHSPHHALLSPPTYPRPLTHTPASPCARIASPAQTDLWSRDQRLPQSRGFPGREAKPPGAEEVCGSLQVDHNDSELWGKQLDQDEQHTQLEAFTASLPPPRFTNGNTGSESRGQRAFEPPSPGSKAKFSPPNQVACLLPFFPSTNLCSLMHQALLLGPLHTSHLICFPSSMGQAFTECLLHSGAELGAGGKAKSLPRSSKTTKYRRELERVGMAVKAND